MGIAGFLPSQRDASAHQEQFFRSLPHLLRHREHYSRHPCEIARRHRQLELLINPADATKDRLPNPPDRFAPTEVLLDPLADHLADPVAGMPRRPAVDGAAATASVVLRHMRPHLALAAGSDEVGGVVGLVGADRLWVGAGNAVEHADRRFAFAGTVGMCDHSTDYQPRAILHQHMPLVGKDRCRVVALPV